MTEPTNNVESLLTAILKNDSSYLVVPQSRVEELLLAIYKNGGGGGGGSDITRYEVEQMLLGKVDTKLNYSLISDSEIERLASVDNYDDKSIREELGKKVEKQNGYSLILNTDYDNFKTLENYDDSELRGLINNISKSLESLVPNDRTIAGKKLDKNISVDDLLKALNLDKVNNTSDLDKPISNATQAALDTKSNKTFIDSVDSETSVVTVPEGTTFAAISKICGKTIKDGEVLKSAPVKSVVSMGKNIIEATYNNTSVDSTGTIVSSTGYNTHIAKVKAGIKYNINKGSDTSVYAFYTSFPVVGSQSYNTTRVVGDTSSRVIVTAPIDGYIAYRTTTTYPNTNINEGETAIAYTPPFKTTVSVPKEILDLPDYGCSAGEVCNWVDFENMKYYHSCYNGKIGDFSYVQMPSDGLFFIGAENVERAICEKYKFVDINVTNNAAAQSGLNDGEFTYRHGDTNDRIYFKDSSIANAGEFKVKNADVKIIYSQHTTTIDISSVIYPFAVESGGTIEFVNEHNLDVPNTVLYKKEV